VITIQDGYLDDVLAVSATGTLTRDDFRVVLMPEGARIPATFCS
jgi:hypothetical protein